MRLPPPQEQRLGHGVRSWVWTEPYAGTLFEDGLRLADNAYDEYTAWLNETIPRDFGGLDPFDQRACLRHQRSIFEGRRSRSSRSSRSRSRRRSSSSRSRRRSSRVHAWGGGWVAVVRVDPLWRACCSVHAGAGFNTHDWDIILNGTVGGIYAMNCIESLLWGGRTR